MLFRPTCRERDGLILYLQGSILKCLQACWQRKWPSASRDIASGTPMMSLVIQSRVQTVFRNSNLGSGLGTEHELAIVRAQPDLYCPHAVCSWGSSRASTHICSSMAADASRQQGPSGGLCMLYTSPEVRLLVSQQQL